MHLLLGVLRDPAPMAAGVLSKRGVAYATLAGDAAAFVGDDGTARAYCLSSSAISASGNSSSNISGRFAQASSRRRRGRGMPVQLRRGHDDHGTRGARHRGPEQPFAGQHEDDVAGAPDEEALRDEALAGQVRAGERDPVPVEQHRVHEQEPHQGEHDAAVTALHPSATADGKGRRHGRPTTYRDHVDPPPATDRGAWRRLPSGGKSSSRGGRTAARAPRGLPSPHANISANGVHSAAAVVQLVAQSGC